MALRIISRHTIKPAQETPNVEISLSESDQLHPITHVPTIYFYKLDEAANDEYPFALAVETLKASFSKLLVPFYAIAGRLYWLPGTQNRLTLQCNAEGAELYVAESDKCIDDYGDFRPSPELRKLIPSVDYSTMPIHETPLVMVQITKFRCGGRSIGFANSHILTDGRGALHFITEFARISRGLELSSAPYLDRTVAWQLADDRWEQNDFEHSELEDLPLVYGSESNREERLKVSEVSILKLTKSQISKLQSIANTKDDDDTTENPLLRRPYSRYEAISAHIWKTVSRARNHKPEQVTNLKIIIDVRHRIHPPLPECYFGNAVFPTFATTVAGELTRNPIRFGAGIIRDTVGKMTNDYVRSLIKSSVVQEDMNKFRNFHTLGCEVGNFLGNPNIDITSWIGLPVYGADFGWGEAIYMGPGGLGYDGKCYILPGLDGDDSLRVALRLQVEHMEAFVKLFYQDI